MKEKIKTVGKVKSVSDPFMMDRTNLHLITIDTKLGLFSIPVDNPNLYGINQEVTITVIIVSED